MKHIWTILCEKSSVDSKTNLLSIFNCVEELSIVIDKTKAPKGDTVLPIEFQLISFWTVDDPKKKNILESQVEIIDPKGDSLNKFNNKFDIKEGVSRQRSITNIHGFKITEAGRYTFRVMQKKEGKKEFKIVAELPLDVKIAYNILKLSPNQER